ncbi:hypothetical protein KWI08_16525 [Morganella morganii]|uniref:hypothetical protein n=1 Tax=Morganella morganii TaxID=582 RepID=UPI0021CF7B00|nr:hypothetical protein [Morganella morganii]MCU6275495.1 hypothetical protein [Morganella morganii]
MDFYDKIKPHYDALFCLTKNLKNKKSDLIIYTDSFIYTNIDFFINKNKNNSNIYVEYYNNQNPIQCLLGGFCDVFISDKNLSVEKNDICKKVLPTEKIGIITHRDIYDRHRNINDIIRKEFFLLKEKDCQEDVFFCMEKYYNVKIKNKKIINDVDLTISLLNGFGYTLNSSIYFDKIGGDSQGFVFISPERSFFLNRYAYFMSDTSLTDDIYDFM